MDILQIFLQNLLSPAILFFALGIAAGLVKSDLDVPESISRYLAIYLMMAIGFKGGAALAATDAALMTLVPLLLAGVGLSLFMPLLGFGLLTATTRLDHPTRAALAGHYGSVSIVTFVTAVSFVQQSGLPYGGHIVAVLAIMEAPAILSALLLARASDAGLPAATSSGAKARLMRDIASNGTIMLLFGSFLIGLLSGKAGLDKMEGFLVTPFQGVLALFLLDMGLLVARQFHHMREFTVSLAAFGIYMPLIGAALGGGTAWLLGLDKGTGALFMVLCASASYIAVPAAMRLALPQAKSAIYLPMSLAITFPFNIVIGLPLYLALAEKFLKA